jgi:hypothetical protein
MLTESFGLILFSVVLVLGARAARAVGVLQPLLATDHRQRVRARVFNQENS